MNFVPCRDFNEIFRGVSLGRFDAGVIPLENSIHGTITQSVPRGNVLRYTVQCGDISFYVDTLFRSFNIYDVGSDVWLSIPEHDCISIRGVEREPANV